MKCLNLNQPSLHVSNSITVFISIFSSVYLEARLWLHTKMMEFVLTSVHFNTCSESKWNSKEKRNGDEKSSAFYAFSVDWNAFLFKVADIYKQTQTQAQPLSYLMQATTNSTKTTI